MGNEVLIDETTARLNTHEAVCAERYESISKEFRGANARLKRIENWMLVAAGGVISGFGSIIFLLIEILAK